MDLMNLLDELMDCKEKSEGLVDGLDNCEDTFDGLLEGLSDCVDTSGGLFEELDDCEDAFDGLFEGLGECGEYFGKPNIAPELEDFGVSGSVFCRHLLSYSEAKYGLLKHKVLATDEMYGGQHFTLMVELEDGSALGNAHFFTHSTVRGRADAFTEAYRVLFGRKAKIGDAVNLSFDLRTKVLTLRAA